MTYEASFRPVLARLWPGGRRIVTANDALVPHAAMRVTDRRVAEVSLVGLPKERPEASWHGQCIEEYWERVAREFQRSGKRARGSPSALIKGN